MIKNMIVIVCVIVLVGLSNMNVYAKDMEVTDCDTWSNVGDGLKYQYEITEIDGNEIHGIALDHISEDNMGVFLYDDEMDFSVNIGDVIRVIWGEYEDEFVSIELDE